MNSSGWDAARNVLCVRLDSLSGVLMCSPAMRAIRQSRPGRCITLLGSPGGAAAAPYIAEVDSVMECAAPPFDTDLIGAIAARHFDAAAIFTAHSEDALPAALACRRAGIPLRLAYCRENLNAVLSHWLPEPDPATCTTHEVRRQLDLVSSIGCWTDATNLSFSVSEYDSDRMRGRLAALRVNPDHQWVLLHLVSKCSAPGHWPTVLRLLAARTGLPLVLAGDAFGPELVDNVRAAKDKEVVLLERILGLGELAAAVQLASVVISDDTGMAHLAAAVGTPVVHLPLPTGVALVPWRVENRVLHGDEPDKIADAACSLLAHRARLKLKTLLHR